MLQYDVEYSTAYRPPSYVTPRLPARLRQPEPRVRLAVRGVPKGALRTHSCLAGSLMGQPSYLCSVLFARAPVLGLCFFVSVMSLGEDDLARGGCLRFVVNSATFCG